MANPREGFWVDRPGQVAETVGDIFSGGNPSVPEPAPTMSLIPAVAALLGFAASTIAEYLRDSRTSEREREAREAARKVQVAERRISFQRETLLSLQEAVLEEARSAGQIGHIDEMEYRKTGKWLGQRLPDGLSDKARNNTVQTLLLMERVRDREIRDLTKVFRSYANQIGVCRNFEDKSRATENMANALPPLHERIGIVLRQLDDDEEAGIDERRT